MRQPQPVRIWKTKSSTRTRARFRTCASGEIIDIVADPAAVPHRNDTLMSNTFTDPLHNPGIQRNAISTNRGRLHAKLPVGKLRFERLHRPTFWTRNPKRL